MKELTNYELRFTNYDLTPWPSERGKMNDKLRLTITNNC